MREEIRKRHRGTLDFDSLDGAADLRDANLWMVGVNGSSGISGATSAQRKAPKNIMYIGRVVAALNYRRLHAELGELDGLLFPKAEQDLPIEARSIRSAMARYVPLTADSFPPAAGSTHHHRPREPLKRGDPVPKGYEEADGDSHPWWIRHISGKAAQGNLSGGSKLHGGYYVPIGLMRDLEYEVVPDTANTDCALVLEMLFYASEASNHDDGPLPLTQYEVDRLPEATRYVTASASCAAGGKKSAQSPVNPNIGAVGGYVTVVQQAAVELLGNLKRRVFARRCPQRNGLPLPRKRLDLTWYRQARAAEQEKAAKCSDGQRSGEPLTSKASQRPRRRPGTALAAAAAAATAAAAPGTPSGKRKRGGPQTQPHVARAKKAEAERGGRGVGRPSCKRPRRSIFGSAAVEHRIRQFDRVWVDAAGWGEDYVYEVESELERSRPSDLVLLRLVKKAQGAREEEDFDARAPLRMLRLAPHKS